MISQIEFNNKKSHDDFNLILDNIEIEYPKPNIIKKTIPFMNGSYDFSNIYGDTTYGDRNITIGFSLDNLADLTRTRVNVLYESIVLWLYSSNTSKLKIDFNEGYFIGRVEEISPIESLIHSGRIEVLFVCNPIRFSENFEGNDVWDIFNFELDYAQETQFNISGSKNIILNNPSIHSIVPEVICSNDMKIIKENITYSFKAGSIKNYQFFLKRGENNLVIQGNGTIYIKFRKEVL